MTTTTHKIALCLIGGRTAAVDIGTDAVPMSRDEHGDGLDTTAAAFGDIVDAITYLETAS